jgi:hypothetical protein
MLSRNGYFLFCHLYCNDAKNTSQISKIPQNRDTIKIIMTYFDENFTDSSKCYIVNIVNKKIKKKTKIPDDS